MEVEFGAVTGDNAGGFLATMLESVEAEIGEFGGFGMAEYAEDTTVVVEVVVEDVLSAHEAIISCLLNNVHVAGNNPQISTTSIGSPIMKSFGSENPRKFWTTL